MEEAIIVENISKLYKLYDSPQKRIKELFSFGKKVYHTDYAALENVSFKVHKGETIGIIGKNGAGKSTLLKLITGVIMPSEGSIKVDGEISALLELGTGFNPEYTGFENIFLNGSMRGLADEEIQDKLQDIIDFADIGKYMNQPVKTYSSGMFARLAFSVMIHFKPDILIVDEALSVGDVFFQQKCNTYMKEKMQGVTKILVTHDINSIANMADRVLLLNKGKIVREGKPLDVIENYLKMMHTEVFSKDEYLDTVEVSSQSKEEKFDVDWNEVTNDDIGGAGEIRIEKTRVLINESSTDIVKPGDEVCVQALLSSKKKCGNIIVGYTFKDKYGNSIFAMNTIGAGIMIEGMEKDSRYMFSLNFLWPEIKEGDYFLTLGIGEGEDQMVHVIQCWAHNIIHVEAITLKPMHGIINHSIDKFDIRKMEE
jgi:teichoic acid transport system ATP-binding protein